jgi:UDP-glucose:(heptosyl)LPS alpha-1,3-glucosyltransferase
LETATGRAAERLARKAGVSDRVGFSGRVDDPAPFYADAFVLPTAHETFFLVSLEAAAARLPRVMTDVGGTEEHLVDGQTGLLISREPANIADALTRLSDPPTRTLIGDKARARARPYSWRRVCEAY